MIKGTVVRAAGFIAGVAWLAGGTAYAADPADSPSPHLRPARHLDRFGRTLEDVCPERTAHQRRCFAHRILGAGASLVQPAAPPGFGGFGDLNCISMGGGGGGAPRSGSMAPKDVLAAYQIPASAAANGKIVALIELPSVHGMADVNAYRKQFGIPELPACPVNGSGVPTPGTTACFARVGEDGTVNSVSSSDCAGWSGETGLDMDMVSAACPDCSIVLAEASSSDDLDKVNTIAATVLGAAAASNSWGGPESGTDDGSPYDNAGILTLAASGDSGFDDEDESFGGGGGANFPASSPYVVAVGGTTLTLSGGQYSEVAWNDASGQPGLFGGGGAAGGSGCSQEFPRPAWQMASGFNFGSCTMRASVDLSAAAQFSPSARGGGIAAYNADDNGWNAVEGTSAATPLTAAIMVRLGLAGKDNHELFYSNASDFNDVTSGSNDNDGLCHGVMCTAGKGWDGPTGLGTPNATRLAQLAGGSLPDAGAAVVDAGISATDAAALPDAGSDDSGPEEASAPPEAGAATGASCSSSSDCASEDGSQDMCVSPGAGQPSVCAPACGSTSSCPSGYACQNGFCFAPPPGAFADTSDLGNKPSGCSFGAAPVSPWSGAAAGALGVLAWIVRRRRAARGEHE